MKNYIGIASIKGSQILDSRGNPTVEAEVVLEDGACGVAAVPSGASTGAYEALELRDGDPSKFGGKGTLKAVNNINGEIAQRLLGENALCQPEIDRMLIALDGTEIKSRLGANSILAVSIACAKAAAESCGLPLYSYLGGVNAKTLPMPMMNVINGGAHASNSVDIQEFMIMPVGAKDFAECLMWCAEVFHALKKVVPSTGVGDEGGYAPMLDSDEEALGALVNGVKAAGFEPGRDFMFSIDGAVSEWYDSSNHTYFLPKRKVSMTGEELSDMWLRVTEKYPIFSREDGMAEEDWDG